MLFLNKSGYAIFYMWLLNEKIIRYLVAVSNMNYYFYNPSYGTVWMFSTISN